MAGSGKGGGGGGEETEEKQQAVLLADSFTDSFRPVSYDMPKVLCPVVNVPMIDYVLELLASNGVEEVIVFCVNHAEELANYLSDSSWSRHMEVRCITSGNCLSAGDALRELDQLGIVRSDPFVLISGDVISNVDLQSVIRKHKEAKSKDPAKIMTMCFHEANSSSSRVRPILEDLVVGLDAETQQVVLFEDSLVSSSLTVPSSLLSGEYGVNVELRSDLNDCHIDICSPEVLVLLSDNFDYQDLRRHFVTNEVANVEMGNKIMAHLIGKQEYCIRVSDFRLYAAASFDFMRRWAYPMVPDNPPSASTVGGSSVADTYSPSYRFGRGYIYRHQNLTLPRSVHLGECCTLGRNVSVGENAHIEGSVLGPDVKVGEGAKILNSYVWEGGRVDAGAVVEGAIVCQGAVVGCNAQVAQGCVLGPGVIVGEGAIIPRFTRLTCVPLSSLGGDDDWGSDEYDPDEAGGGGGRAAMEGEATSELSSLALLGPGGKGRLWKAGEEEDEEEDDMDLASSEEGDGVHNRVHCQSIGCVDEEKLKADRWDEYLEDEEEILEDDDDNEGDFTMYSLKDDGVVGSPPSPSSSSFLESRLAAAAAAGAVGQTPSKESINFHKVIKDLLLHGHLEGHQTDNLLLEIKGYKFAQNNSFAACIAPAVEATLEIASAGGSTGMELVATVKKQLTAWEDLLQALLQNNDDQLAMICAVERAAVESDDLSSIFRFVLQVIYDMDFVSEDALLGWADMRRSGKGDSEELALFRNPKIQEFVDWLEEEDEDEEDSDEEEDEE